MANGISAANLTGVWSGVYSYTRLLSSVSFLATLIEADSVLTGGVRETAPDGPAKGRALDADLAGARTGLAVTFVKRYRPSARYHDTAVIYEGVVSADGTRIEGRWRIPGHWDGPFAMTRSDGEPQVAAVRAEALV